LYGDSKPKYYIPLPLILGLSSVHIQNINQNLFKKSQVLCLHGIFMLPSSIFRIVADPLNFYYLYILILEKFDFSVQYAHWLDLKVSLWLYLNQISINNMVSIMYIRFQQRDMKYIMHIHGSKQCKHVCN
jgi:hypothetical protein